MTALRTTTRISAALCAATLLGAGVATAQPLDIGDDAQHGLGATAAGNQVEPFAACQAVGTPLSLERSLCYRSAANLANERSTRPSAPPTSVARPIVIAGTSFDWTDAGVGFAAAAGLGLLGAGTGVAVRARRLGTSPR
jgi:hypothetical protein